MNPRPAVEILIGTRNRFKASEMAWHLDGLPDVNIQHLEGLDIAVVVEEDQPKLRGNAEKKAVEISKLTDLCVLTSDAGVDIPALGAKWDVLRNQRTVGEDKSDREKVQVLIGLMRGLENGQRQVQFHLDGSYLVKEDLHRIIKDINFKK